MAVIPKSTYYDKHNRQSAALIRARRPYLVRNIITGTAIFGFAIGVYAFTIRAVAQDNFDDVVVPDSLSKSQNHQVTDSSGQAPAPAR